ncbi:hypothetical protein C6P45_002331 [Maudiozyma exigua]|uniref:Uncharacterized protein n=1 Tax=Maudiozyma exigua TaxID=34358 RepID=A0A9P7B489_MAUEX|nr:hypothetical protein C6P45_002331 [Kazachstania exigua]
MSNITQLLLIIDRFMEELDVPLEPLLKLFRLSNQHLIIIPNLLTVLECSVNNDFSPNSNYFPDVASYNHVSSSYDSILSDGTILSSIFSTSTDTHDSITSCIHVTDIFDKHNKSKSTVVKIVSHSKSAGSRIFQNRDQIPQKKHNIRRWKNK